MPRLNLKLLFADHLTVREPSEETLQFVEQLRNVNIFDFLGSQTDIVDIRFPFDVDSEVVEHFELRCLEHGFEVVVIQLLKQGSRQFGLNGGHHWVLLRPLLPICNRFF